MSKFTKAPEVKKYKNMSVRIWTFGFNFINEMSLIFLYVIGQKRCYFPMTEILNLLHFEIKNISRIQSTSGSPRYSNTK